MPKSKASNKSASAKKFSISAKKKAAIRSAKFTTWDDIIGCLPYHGPPVKIEDMSFPHFTHKKTKRKNKK